jgi:hypothetical protein
MPLCPALSDMGVVELGAQHLIDLAGQLCSTPAASPYHHTLAQLGFEWFARFLELLQRYRASAKRSASSSALQQFDALRALQILPLQNGAWLVPSAVPEGSVYFSIDSGVDSQRNSTYSFQRDLRTISPHFWTTCATLSPALQSAVRDLFKELFGVRQYSKRSVIESHLVPLLKSKSLELVQRPSAPIIEHWRDYACLLVDYQREQNKSVAEISRDVNCDLRELFVLVTVRVGSLLIIPLSAVLIAHRISSPVRTKASFVVDRIAPFISPRL